MSTYGVFEGLSFYVAKVHNESLHEFFLRLANILFFADGAGYTVYEIMALT